jgi:hypothetical protein
MPRLEGRFFEPKIFTLRVDGRRRGVALKRREPGGFCTPATWHSLMRAIWPRSIAHWSALGTDGVSNDQPKSRSPFLERERSAPTQRSRPPPVVLPAHTLGVDMLSQFSADGTYLLARYKFLRPRQVWPMSVTSDFWVAAFRDCLGWCMRHPKNSTLNPPAQSASAPMAS